MFWLWSIGYAYFFPQAAITCCASGMCPLVATAVVTTPSISIFAIPLSIITFIFYIYKYIRTKLGNISINEEFNPNSKDMLSTSSIEIQKIKEESELYSDLTQKQLELV